MRSKLICGVCGGNITVAAVFTLELLHIILGIVYILQHCQKLVRYLESATRQCWCSHFCEHIELLGWVGSQVVREVENQPVSGYYGGRDCLLSTLVSFRKITILV